MLYGQFPFHDPVPAALFRRISSGEFSIPPDFATSHPTVQLIQSLLVRDPQKRPTAQETLENLEDLIRFGGFLEDTDLQTVPVFQGLTYEDNYIPRSKYHTPQNPFPEVSGADAEQLLSNKK